MDENNLDEETERWKAVDRRSTPPLSPQDNALPKNKKTLVYTTQKTVNRLNLRC